MRPDGHTDTASAPSWARSWMADSAQLLGSQVLTVAATSLAAITIARTLDPDDWAVFSAFLGLSLALALVADFGISTWLLRELSLLVTQRSEGQWERIGRLMTSGVVITGAIAIPLIAAAGLWAAVARPAGDAAIALFALLVYGALTTSASALESFLRARREVRVVLIASVLEKTILIVLILGAAIADLGLGAIGIAYLVAGLVRITFAGVVVFVWRRVPLVLPSVRTAAGIARSSMPIALNAASLNLVPRLDTLVLVLMSTTSAAWFAIGDRVLGPLLLVPGTLAAALYPFMATHAAKGASPWRLAGAMALVGAALAGVGIVLAPYLVPLLFGDAYESSVPVVQVMLVSAPLVYAASPLLVIAYSHHRETSLLLPILGLSLIGTVAIVAGQALGGPVLAGAGVVVRYGLFFLVVGAVALAAWRRHLADVGPGDVPTRSPASAQAS